MRPPRRRRGRDQLPDDPGAAPGTVLEIGSARGWSTTWLLRALHDNGAGGVLHTFDLTDDAVQTVPRPCPPAGGGSPAATCGAARSPTTPGSCSSTRHTRRGSPAGTPPRSSNGSARVPPSPSTTSSTAAARGRSARAQSCSSWLRRRGIGHLTASPAADPDTHDRLVGLKQKLRLAAPVHATATGNPMLFFRYL